MLARDLFKAVKEIINSSYPISNQTVGTFISFIKLYESEKKDEIHTMVRFGTNEWNTDFSKVPMDKFVKVRGPSIHGDAIGVFYQSKYSTAKYFRGVFCVYGIMFNISFDVFLKDYAKEWQEI